MSDSTASSPGPDPVLAEVWRIKEEIAAEHDYDVRKIGAAAMEAQKRHRGRVVDLSRNRSEQGGLMSESA